MNTNTCRAFASLVASALTFALSSTVGAQGVVPESSTNRPTVQIRVSRGMHELVRPKTIKAAFAATNAGAERGSSNISTQSFHGFFFGATLPLWTFDIKGSRDGDHHVGVMVGHDPFHHPGTDRISTKIIPLIITTHSVAKSIDDNPASPTFGQYAVVAGNTTIDPTKIDNSCLKSPNNLPIRVMRQSPVFEPAKFVFGGTNVGTTQYTDAFQRGNFWNALGDDRDNYHVQLNPVSIADPVVIDVPANEGLAVTDPNFYLATIFGFSFCAPMLFVDINWFDSFIQGTVIPELQEAGVIDPTVLPIFTSYNSAWPVANVNNIFNCCAAGYHNATGVPIVTQTYSAVDFDTSGWFAGPPQGLNTDILSHEVGEWMNDPFGSNLTAPWGGTGQVQTSCQANLEVGDPLTGTDVAPVTMPNGFTYNLQELAFFSWFFGAPSVSVNGWFSNNNTFKKDAGPNCPNG